MISLFESLVRGIARWRWPAAALCALALLASWAAYYRAVGGDLKKLPVDNRIESWFLDDDLGLVAYRAFQDRFGNDEVVLVLLRAPAGEDLFTPGSLNLVSDLSARLGRLRRIAGVTSLSTVLWIGEGGDGVEVTPFWEGRVADAPAAARIRARLEESVLYRRELVSPDGRATLVTARLAPIVTGSSAEADEAVRIADVDAQRGEILAEVRAEVEGALRAAGREPTGAWAWGGLGVVNEELNQLSIRDGNTLLGLSCLVIVGVLLVVLRRVRPAGLSLLAVYLATAWLMGCFLALGFQFNMVTMILPTLVLVVGLTDAIYFVTHYYDEREALEARGRTKREAIGESVAFCAVPGFINSATTAVAFLAFGTAKVAVIRHLGLFAGLGIALAFVATLVVMTVGFDVLDVRPPPKRPDGQRSRVLGPFLARLAELVIRRPRWVLAGGALLLLACVGGLARLQVDTYTMRYFRPDHPVRAQSDAIEREFGAYLPLELVVDTGRQDGLYDPVVLRALQALGEQVVAEEPTVDGAVSLADVVCRLNAVFNGAHEVPSAREAVEQELLFYDPARRDDPLTLLDVPGARFGRLTLRIKTDSARNAAALIERIERRAATLLPAGCALEPAGVVPLYVRLVQYLVEEQIESLAITFCLVLVIVALLFRSWRYALVALPPNLLPIAATLGYMGYRGIDLDMGTVLIAAIALGISVDDTVHILYRYHALRRHTTDVAAALRETLASAGLAILATSVVIALGFSVFLASQVSSMATFGALMALTVVLALVGDLAMTPALILLFDPERPAPDWTGESFRALAAAGEHVGIRFGTVPRAALVPEATPDVAWTFVPHTECDGVGALGRLLRAEGATLETLPGADDAARAPGPLATARALARHDASALKDPPVPWRDFDPTTRPPSGEAPRAVAWRVLSAERTAALEAAATARGASLNSLLLWALDRSAPARLAHDPARRTWMVPVNLRGPLSASPDTQNLSSYLPVRLADAPDPAAVHGEVKQRLAGGAQWAAWATSTAGALLGRRLSTALLRSYYRRPAHAWQGAFSNLGAWPPAGCDLADDGTQRLFCPPVLKTIPLSAGALTWRGRLSLVVTLHAGFGASEADAAALLDAWLAALPGDDPTGEPPAA